MPMAADSGYFLLADHERPRQRALHSPRHQLGAVHGRHARQHQTELVAAGARDPVLDDDLFGARRSNAGPARSPSRRQCCRRFATSFNRTSPTAGPCVSLMREKSSMSSIKHARCRVCRARPMSTCSSRICRSRCRLGKRGQRIVVGEVAHPRLARDKLVLGSLGAHQEFHPLREQHRVDALRGEIRGAGGVGALDRLHVVQAGLDQDRARGGSWAAPAARCTPRNRSSPA